MADATAEFFEELNRRGHETLLEKARGTVRFDLKHGTKTDRWLVTIDKGDVSVSRRNVAADCTLRTDKAKFDGMARGEVNAVAAVLRGEMGFEGEPQLLVLFQRLFPGPRGARGPRRGTDGARRLR